MLRRDILIFVAATAAVAAVTGVLGSYGASLGDHAPKVFTYTQLARGGDIVSVQGANFDPSTKVYQLDGSKKTALPILGRVNEQWLAVKLRDAPLEPTALELVTEHGDGVRLPLNAATPQMIDATQITPGGPMRVAGLNLLSPDHPPTVLIGGLRATVDLSASDENMLVLTAPEGLVAGSQVEITCDNGNGNGPSALKGRVAVGAGTGDPLRLGVGWGAAFAFADRVLDVANVCRGASDDAPAIEAAIQQMAASGGGRVRLPAGECRIASTIKLASKVVLQGAGEAATTLRYEANFPISAIGVDLVGLEALGVVNSGSVQEGVMWNGNTRSFIRNVSIKMQKSHQWFLVNNQDMVFADNEVEQTDSYDLQNPFRFDLSRGLVFIKNRIRNVNGSPTFLGVHDAFVLNNRFTRDARSQNEQIVVAHHRFALDFSYRTAVIGNTFDVDGGPIVNVKRNDGETILSEGGGPLRTENLGVAQAFGRNTLEGAKDAVELASISTSTPPNFGVAIVSGNGAGQVRRVVNDVNSVMTVDRDWDIIPEPGSHFSTFVWGLEDVIIKDNRLFDNPRGIWLYQTSAHNVLVQGNQIKDGGGIYLRTYQNLKSKMFNVQENIIITDNQIVNDSGRWMSYVIVAFVNTDADAFGTSQFGIVVRRNTLTANSPNVTSNVEDYAAFEGYANLVKIVAPGKHEVHSPNSLGAIYQSNVCQRCAKPFTASAIGGGVIWADNSADKVRFDNHP